jgi:hypothetical protein
MSDPTNNLTFRQWVRLATFHFQWNVRDVVAGMLQDLARWIAP